MAHDLSAWLERTPAVSSLRKAYREGDLVLMVGAGISRAAGLPTWSELVQRLRADAAARPGGNAELEEVDELVAQGKLVAAISILARRLGPATFHRSVQQQLDCESRPVPAVAEAIAALAPGLRYVLTTNLDRILERALGWEGVVAADGDFAHDGNIVLKLHGTRRRPGTWVMTQEDYDRAMHADDSTRANVEAILRTRTLLFVGFGLVDDHFDLLFSRLSARAKGSPPPSYALLHQDEQPASQRQRQLAEAGLQLVPYEDHARLPQILLSLTDDPDSPRAGRVEPGAVVFGGRYELLERLGDGRTSSVFRARDRHEDANVALRVLHPHLMDDQERRQRFVRAAEHTRAAGDLPGLVSVRSEIAEDHGTLFHTVRLVEGTSLRQAILERRLGHDELCEVVRRVARSLRSLHQRSLVHGRVTPRTIIIDEGNDPWLTELAAPGEGPEAGSLYAPPSAWGRTVNTPSADVHALAMAMAFGLHGDDLPLDVLRDLGGFLDRLECSAELRELLSSILRANEDGPELADVRIFFEPLSRAQWSVEDINRINVQRNIERSLFDAPTANIKLGKFELLTRVGGGSFSEVHRARDTSLGRDVALKLITATRIPVGEFRERIHREATALTRLHHPHVVQVYDYEPHGKHPFIVMRFVEGILASKWLLDRTLGWQAVVSALRAAGEGLRAMHAVDLVHRDFKPGNLIVEATPVPAACIVDFGLARPAGPPPDGTPAYMAPEHAAGGAEPRSDQFSFCVSLFEGLYGHRPFEGSSRSELLRQIEVGPPAPRQDPRGTPPGILGVLQRGLRADAAERYPSMGELLADLDAQARAAISEPSRLLWESLRGVFSR